MNEVNPTVIAYEDPSFLIVDKPSGLPTVPMKNSNHDQPSLLYEVAKEYPEILSVNGRNSWEGGVLHRLDTPTRGLVVIARTTEAFHRMQAIAQADLFIKEYEATSSGHRNPALEGFPPFPYEDPVHCGGREVNVGSLFRHWGEGRATVRPVLADSPRHLLEKSSPTWYLTRIVYTGSTDSGAERFRCRLTNGFRHQVRAHLAWSGWPIDGDDRYGGKESPTLGLRATAVEFPHPFISQQVEVRLDG